MAVAIANDTFVEGSDTTLTSHTPTGTNAGAGWATAAGGGTATVRAATDDVVDASGASGNRFRMTTDLGSAQMNVSAVITSTAAALAFPGVLFRVSSAGSGGEFTYDSGTRWYVFDGVTETTATEAWPGGAVTMLMQNRTGSQRAYVNGALKITVSADNLNTNQYGGLILGNFTGSAGQSSADDFLSSGFLTGPLIGGRLLRGGITAGTVLR